MRSAKVTVNKTILLLSSRCHGEHGRSAVSSRSAVMGSTKRAVSRSASIKHLQNS